MALTKADIVAEIYGQGILSKSNANQAVEQVLELIKSHLVKGEDVLISGFGRWAVRSKIERQGRNPQTGKRLTLSARRTVAFRPSRILKLKIQNATEPGKSTKINSNGSYTAPRLRTPSSL